jgi:hypothetical protein
MKRILTPLFACTLFLLIAVQAKYSIAQSPASIMQKECNDPNSKLLPAARATYCGQEAVKNAVDPKEFVAKCVGIFDVTIQSYKSAQKLQRNPRDQQQIGVMINSVEEYRNLGMNLALGNINPIWSLPKDAYIQKRDEGANEYVAMLTNISESSKNSNDAPGLTQSKVDQASTKELQRCANSIVNLSNGLSKTKVQIR